jgi:hypothetical protein
MGQTPSHALEGTTPIDARPSEAPVDENQRDLIAREATDLPLLLVDRANLPATARALGEYLAAAENLFERGCSSRSNH